MKIEKNKKVSIDLFTSLILVALLFCFNFFNQKTNIYDTSQEGSSEMEGKFITEQHTDYIFTTVKAEFRFDYEIIFLIIESVIAVFIWRKLREKYKS